MPAKIAISRCENYYPNVIKKQLIESIEKLGGIEKFIQKGQRVLLKPNILTNTPPESAVTTHPEVVRAVAEIAIAAGADVVIGDSPAIMDLEKCAKATGIYQVAKDLNIPLVSFDDSVPIDLEINSEYKHLDIARPVWEADVIINIPKVKTHLYMYLTLAIKNCFGIIKGVRKAKWHIEAGKSPMQFAKVMISCWQAMKPDLTIVDGIVGMEGDGPQSGSPRKLDFLMVGTDCAAIDRTICELLRLDPEKFHVIKLAKQMGIGETDMSQIEILGEPLNSFNIENFKTPNRSPFMPKILYRYFRDALTDTPHINQKKCRKCGNCEKICPAAAISHSDNGNKDFSLDTRKCIRCFCCHEICPFKAIDIRKGLILRILELFIKSLKE